MVFHPLRQFAFVCALACHFAACDRGEEPATTAPAVSSTVDGDAQDRSTTVADDVNPVVTRPIARTWSRFRGDARNSGATTERLVPPLRIRWRHSTTDNEPVTATAAIVDGAAYVGSLIGEFLAIDLATGDVRWTFRTKDESGIASSACIADGSVFFGDEFGFLYCLDIKSGESRWQFEAGAEIISSPHVVDGLVVFGCYDGVVYAIDATSGKARWTFKTDAQIHSTVAVVDDKVLAAGCDGALHVIGMRDGKEIRAVRFGGQTASSVAVRGDHAYLGTLGNEVLCINWKNQEIIWQYRDAAREFPFQSSAALWKQLVILGGRDKALHALDQETGDLRWRYSTRGRVDSSPVVAGGIAFVGSQDGRLYALDAASGDKRWEFEAGGAVSASPAIADGVVVIGTEDGVIYCLESERKRD